MGLNERNIEASNSSIYNTLLYIDDKGNIAGKHRKLVPTSGEPLVWASGDGSTLESYDTNIGKLERMDKSPVIVSSSIQREIL